MALSGHYTPGWRYRYDEAAWKWWHGGAPHCAHVRTLLRQNPELLEERAFPLPERCPCCYYNYSRGLPPGPGWYPGAWSHFCQSYTWTWSDHLAPHYYNMDWQDLESGSEPDDDQGWVFTEPGATGMHYGPARKGLADWGHDWYFKAGPYYDPSRAPNLQVYPEHGLYHDPYLLKVLWLVLKLRKYLLQVLSTQDMKQDLMQDLTLMPLAVPTLSHLRA